MPKRLSKRDLISCESFTVAIEAVVDKLTTLLSELIAADVISGPSTIVSKSDIRQKKESDEEEVLWMSKREEMSGFSVSRCSLRCVP